MRFEQFLYQGAFALAFFSFWLWGQAFGRSVLKLPRLRAFTAICLGQLAALAFAHLATLAALRLIWLMPAASLFLLYRQRKAGFSISVAGDLLTPFGLACCAVVVAVYTRHLSALGLDTHEHTAWVEQILKSGRVPLAEPGTAIVADYPRTFHLLTAVWTAAGLGLPAGPFVKAMPFLQNALPMLAVAGIVEEAAVRRSGEPARPLLQLALGAAFFVYSFLLTPLAYPAADLSGTARYASAAVLLAPVVLLLLAALHRSPAAGVAAWATAPLAGAWALTMNPILPAMLLSVSLPVCVVLWFALRPPLRSRRAGVAAVSAALGLLCVAQDPWIASQAAKHSPRIAALLERRGLVQFDAAVRRGLATPRDKSVRNATAKPPCAERACVQRLAAGALVHALFLPARAAAAAAGDARSVATRPSLAALKRAFEGAMPLQPAAFADYAALPYLLVVAAGALIALARALRRRKETRPESFSPERFLAAALVACALAGICLAFAGGLGSAFDDGTHESGLLDTYLNWAPHHVSLSLLWLPFAGACAALASSTRAPLGRLHPLLLVAWLALPLTARLNLHLPLRNEGFLSPVHLADVRAFRDLERAIPPDDAVLIPAEHWNVAESEHWVIPVGPTTALLPYGERRYLFDVYLGASYPLSWRDLEDRLCSRDPAVRRAFLDRQRARWLLVRDEAALDAADALRRQKLCGEPLSSFGVELPEVRHLLGIRLFRLSGLP